MKTLNQQQADAYFSKAKAAGFSQEAAQKHLQDRGITIETPTATSALGNKVGEFVGGAADTLKGLVAPPVKFAGAVALKGFQGADYLASKLSGTEPTQLTEKQQRDMDLMMQQGLSPRNIRDTLLTLSPLGRAKFASLALPAGVSEFALSKYEGAPTGEAARNAALMYGSTKALGFAKGPKSLAALGAGVQGANVLSQGENPLSAEGLGGMAAAGGLGYLGGKAEQRGISAGLSDDAQNKGLAGTMVKGEAKSLVSQVSGLSSESQAAAFDPQTRTLTEGMLSGAREPTSVVNRVHEVLNRLTEDVSDTGKEYEFVRQSKQVEPVPIDVFDSTLKEFGLQFVPEGPAEVSPILGNKIQNGHLVVDPSGPAKRMSPMALDQLEAFMKMAGGVRAITPEVFKQAKSTLTELGSFYDPSVPGGGGAIKGLAGKLFGTLEKIRDNATTDDFKVYKQLDERYAPKIRQLDEIRGFFEPDPATGKMRIKDSARGKILNALKGTKTNLVNDLERIAPGITREIRAYETYQNITAENKPGQYVRAGAKGVAAGYMTAGTPGAVAGGIAAIFASEPRVVFSLLSKIAKTKEMFGLKPEEVIFKAERGIPLNPKETAALKQAAAEYKPDGFGQGETLFKSDGFDQAEAAMQAQKADNPTLYPKMPPSKQ